MTETPINPDDLKPQAPFEGATPIEQSVYETAYRGGLRDWQNQELKQQLDKTVEDATVIAKALFKSKHSEKLDAKTGLLNPVAFAELARQKTGNVKRSRDRGRSHVLLIGDLDDFTNINDTLGYQGADNICLLPTAEIIKSSIREGDDIASRFGGEEFLILLTDTDLEGALKVVGAIRDQVNSIHLNDKENLGISFGVAPFNQGTEYSDVFNWGNAALKEAKGHPGKNMIKVYDSEKPAN